MAYVDSRGNLCDCMNPTINIGIRPCVWVHNTSYADIDKALFPISV